MKPVLIIPIDIFPSLNIRGYRYVIKISEVDDFQRALEIASNDRQCISILCDFKNIDIVSLLKIEMKPSVHVYINSSFSGDILSLTKALYSGANSEDFNSATFLFPDNTPNLVVLLKILSSCGFKSGLQIVNDNIINKDDFEELATYSYLTPVAHAQIEPFGYILQEVSDKRKYVDLNTFYFNSPDTFVHIEHDGSVLLKSEFPEFQKVLCSSVEELDRIDFSEISMEYKKLRFYNHFDSEDKCSKCANFKICSGYFMNRLEDCKGTLSSIYEMLY